MEIERKYLLKSLPDIPFEKHVRITQGYLSIKPEVRIRSYEVLEGVDKGHVDYMMTVKGDGNLSREEIEFYIQKDVFDKLAGFIGKPLIVKDYWKYPYDGHILECSAVDPGTETGFIYGEIEFGTEKEAQDYQISIKEAVDVTNDQSYKMKNYWKKTRLKDYETVNAARQVLCAFCENDECEKCIVALLADQAASKDARTGIIEED